MSTGDVDEANRCWSIVIPSFVCLTPNSRNLKVPFSYVLTLNILFNSLEMYHFCKIWNHLHARITIKLSVASCQRNITLSYVLTIPFRLVNSWLTLLHHQWGASFNPWFNPSFQLPYMWLWTYIKWWSKKYLSFPHTTEQKRWGEIKSLHLLLHNRGC